MQARKWLVITISLILVSAGAVVGFNIAVDLYGLFRAGPGDRRVVYGDSRVAKYLLNSRYVPMNFNTVLIGSSLSANWDMTAIEKLRVYNDSINGANIIEEKAILEQALSRPGISRVLMLVHPALTYSHDYKTVDLNPSLKYSAFGSRSLWEAYKDVLKIRLRRARLLNDYAGTENFEFVPKELNPTMKAMWRAGGDFDIDPNALGAYRHAVEELHARHIPIVFIVPPTYEGLLQDKPGAFAKYVRMIQPEAGPEDKWIDLSSEKYADFRKDRSNFEDGVHFTVPAAKQVVSFLNATLNDWVARGEFNPPR